MRTRLVVSSIAVHIAVVMALVISGFWKIDRLSAERSHVDLVRVASLEDPPGGGTPPPAAAPKMKPKQPHKTVVTKIVQPEIQHPELPPVPEATSTGSADGSAAGSGDGSGDGSGGTGTGSGAGSGSGGCTTDCGSGAGSADKETFVPPPLLKGLRIAGDPQIHPPDSVKITMQHEGQTKLTGVYKICLGEDGYVSSISPLHPTGYPAYDAKLVAGIQTWRYRPYLVGGRPVPVCSTVTFIYAMQ